MGSEKLECGTLLVEYCRQYSEPASSGSSYRSSRSMMRSTVTMMVGSMRTEMIVRCSISHSCLLSRSIGRSMSAKYFRTSYTFITLILHWDHLWWPTNTRKVGTSKGRPTRWPPPPSKQHVYALMVFHTGMSIYISGGDSPLPSPVGAHWCSVLLVRAHFSIEAVACNICRTKATIRRQPITSRFAMTIATE